jgi:hypothetical protein
MADPQNPLLADKSKIRLVDQDVVQLEFLIDDLVKQLTLDRLRPVANCNGCNACSSVVDLPTSPTRS